jgi:hypothetical protein
MTKMKLRQRLLYSTWHMGQRNLFFDLLFRNRYVVIHVKVIIEYAVQDYYFSISKSPMISPSLLTIPELLELGDKEGT